MGSPGDSRALGGGAVNSFLAGGGAKMGSFSLARQTSIYSLTLEEFKNTLGEPGKNFGSMNMDDFLKNIWTAEESQAMAAAMGAAEGIVGGNLGREASLQRQGSLTLPRTLSRKTVDEVWRDIYKENTTNGDVNGNGCETTQRQATFQEMTLEDFLVKAGVVREDTEPYGGRFDNEEFGGFGGHPMDRNEESLGGISNSLALGFPDRGGTVNGDLRGNKGVMAGGTLNLSPTSNALSNQAAMDAMNMEALKSSHQQQTDWLNNQYRTAVAQQQQQQHHHQLLQQQQQQQQQVADAAAAAVYASSVKRQGNGVLMGPVIGGSLALSPTGMGNGLHGGLGVGGLGLGASTLGIGGGSPANQLSSDGVGTSHGDNSTVSPMYGMESGLRGRKRGGPVEKVIERRQRRMIKNRESAARSRARKQAYTVELEAEVTQLKEENRELRKKQEEMSEKCKRQITEMMASLSRQTSSQTETLRRTQSGMW